MYTKIHYNIICKSKRCLSRTDYPLSPLNLGFTEPHLASESQQSDCLFQKLLAWSHSCSDYSYLWLWLPGACFLVKSNPVSLVCGWGEESKLNYVLITILKCSVPFTAFFSVVHCQQTPPRSFMDGASMGLREWIKRGLKLPRHSWNLLTRLYFFFCHLHQFFSIIITFLKLEQIVNSKPYEVNSMNITKFVSNMHLFYYLHFLNYFACFSGLLSFFFGELSAWVFYKFLFWDGNL